MEYLVLTNANILKLGFENLEILAMHVKKMQAWSSQQGFIQSNPFEFEPFKSKNLISSIQNFNLENLSKLNQDHESESANQSNFENTEDIYSTAVSTLKVTKFNLNWVSALFLINFNNFEITI